MNPVVHFEMPCRDARRAARFYAAAFGWDLRVTRRDPGRATHGVTAVDGEGHPRPDAGPGQYPCVVIGVDELHAAMQRVVAAGGRLAGEPQHIPGVGAFVAFIDSEGNRHGMLQLLRSAQHASREVVA
jgi:predicted enzyme related to lactoylglutathione lyase